MKTLKKLFVIVLGVFAAQYAQAQSNMMDPVSFKLKNGMTVIVAENKGTSKVYSSFVIDAEPVPEGNKAGVQEILNAMLNETVSLTASGISFDEKGGNIASTSADFDNALSVLSVSVQHPTLTQALFDRLKAKLGISVKQNDHYYPESLTENSPEELSLDDVRAFYATHMLPSRSYLTIAGSITPAAAKALVKKTFGDWGEVYFSVMNK